MPVSRVIFNGRIVLDVSKDSVTRNTLFENTTAHSANGDRIIGAIPKTSITGFYVDSNGILHLSDDGG